MSGKSLGARPWAENALGIIDCATRFVSLYVGTVFAKEVYDERYAIDRFYARISCGKRELLGSAYYLGMNPSYSSKKFEPYVPIITEKDPYIECMNRLEESQCYPFLGNVKKGELHKRLSLSAFVAANNLLYVALTDVTTSLVEKLVYSKPRWFFEDRDELLSEEFQELPSE